MLANRILGGQFTGQWVRSEHAHEHVSNLMLRLLDATAVIHSERRLEAIEWLLFKACPRTQGRMPYTTLDDSVNPRYDTLSRLGEKSGLDPGSGLYWGVQGRFLVAAEELVHGQEFPLAKDDHAKLERLLEALSSDLQRRLESMATVDLLFDSYQRWLEYMATKGGSGRSADALAAAYARTGLKAPALPGRGSRQLPVPSRNGGAKPVSRDLDISKVKPIQSAARPAADASRAAVPSARRGNDLPPAKPPRNASAAEVEAWKTRISSGFTTDPQGRLGRDAGVEFDAWTGTFTVTMHGRHLSGQIGSGQKLLDILRSNPLWKRQLEAATRTKLLSCRIGKTKIPQELADASGKVVKSANEVVFPNGLATGGRPVEWVTSHPLVNQPRNVAPVSDPRPYQGASRPPVHPR